MVRHFESQVPLLRNGVYDDAPRPKSKVQRLILRVKYLTSEKGVRRRSPGCWCLGLLSYRDEVEKAPTTPDGPHLLRLVVLQGMR